MGPTRYVKTLRGRILDNLRELQVPEFGLDRAIVSNIITKQCRYIDDHGGLLADRAGRLVEAHGDLRPEHVYLGSRLDPPCVIDCLEFDAKLRRMDPAEEVAFLALECRRLGAESMARSLIHGVQLSLDDAVPESLTYFYMSHRALTRAKMAAWHLRDPRRPRRVRHWKERARVYIEDALYFAELAVRRSEQRRCVSHRQPQANASTGAQWACQMRSA
jgi:aminoglycoside phosphotransferase family enzyme